MKILLDANLSWRLGRLLKDFCEEVIHVESTQLASPARDIDIWNFAKSNGYVLATNDEDFAHLLVSKGFPPKIILFRTGNQDTKAIAALFNKHKDEIESLHNSDKVGILEIF